jgi:uncharacterized protein YxeA
MSKVSPEDDPSYVPNVVYDVTPMKLKPSNVLIGVIVGAVIIAIGVIGAFIILYGFQSDTSSNATVTTTNTSKTPTSTPSAKKDETANWETYTNSVGKFQLKYPPGMVVDVESVEEFGLANLPKAGANESILLTFENDTRQGIYIESAVNMKDKTDAEFGPKLWAQTLQESAASESKLTKITIGEKVGYKLEFEETEETKPYQAVIIHMPGKNSSSLIRIIITTTDKRSQVVNKILSTFKFLD